VFVLPPAATQPADEAAERDRGACGDASCAAATDECRDRERERTNRRDRRCRRQFEARRRRERYRGKDGNPDRAPKREDAACGAEDEQRGEDDVSPAVELRDDPGRPGDRDRRQQRQLRGPPVHLPCDEHGEEDEPAHAADDSDPRLAAADHTSDDARRP
jgi:hypothetical protein